MADDGRFSVHDFTYDFAGRAIKECRRQALMSDEAEEALWAHMASVIELLKGELATVHKCWDEDTARLRELAGRLAEALRHVTTVCRIGTPDMLPPGLEHAETVLAEYDAVQRKTQP